MVKQSKINTWQPKTLEDSNINDKKPNIIEHPKTSHKLSKTLSQPEPLLQVGGAGKVIIVL